MIDDRLNQIKNKISKLSSMGVDIQGYKKELNSITSKKYNSYGDSAFAYSSEDTCDSEIIKLESELNEYDLIIEFYNYCNKIKPALLNMLFNKSKDEINLDELNSYIKKIQDYLINLKHDKNNTVNLTKIYEIVYYLIELEIIKTNRSTLYDFIIDKHIDIRYINSIIMNKINDTNNIKKEDKEKYLIKERLDRLILKLNNIGSNINYFNIEIIKLLLMLQNNYDAYKELEKDFDFKLKELSSQDGAINHYKEKSTYELDSVKFYINSLKETKSDLKKKIISTMLALSVIITGAFGIERGARKSNSTNLYSKETEITSTLNDDKEIQQEEYLSDKDTCDNERYISVLGPWENTKDNTISRYVKEYDITSLGLNTDNLDDIDIDSIKVEPNYYIETLPREDTLELQMYDEPITELRNVSYTYQGKELIKYKYASDLFIFYILYICILTLLYVGKLAIFDNSEFLYEIIKYYINNKKDKKDSDKDLEKNLCELLKYINENKELREEFNKLYQENIDLLSDTEELKNRLDETISEFEDYDKSAEMILKRKKALEK